jgi:hypothetical protein
VKTGDEVRLTLVIEGELQTDLPGLSEDQLVALMFADKAAGLRGPMAGFVGGDEYTHGTQIVIASTRIEVAESKP